MPPTDQLLRAALFPAESIGQGRSVLNRSWGDANPILGPALALERKPVGRDLKVLTRRQLAHHPDNVGVANHRELCSGIVDAQHHPPGLCGVEPDCVRELTFDPPDDGLGNEHPLSFPTLSSGGCHAD
jgi:hypothetical protein